jgi:hypothetical protein
MKHLISLLLIAFASMHLIAFTVSFIRFQLIREQSLILGLVFLGLGIFIYKKK